MTFLPIAAREPRVAARRRATYWLRFCLALAVLVIWFFLVVLTGAWLLLGLAVDLAFAHRAKFKLLRSLRETPLHQAVTPANPSSPT